MSSAFGEPPDSGENVSPRAAGAAIRIANRAAPSAATSRRRGMPEGKARGSYLRLPPRLHFVADASDTRLIWGSAAKSRLRVADGCVWAAEATTARAAPVTSPA